MPSLKTAVTLGVLLPLSGAAHAANVVSQEVPLKPKVLKLKLSSGELTVSPGAPGKLVYAVEWVEGNSWSFLGWKSKGPSAEDIAACSATYDAESGLVIEPSRGVGAKVKVSIPPAQALELEMGAGTLELGKLTNVSARLDAGTLEYDGSALPKGACVDGVTKAGTVENERDRDCKTTPIKLRVGAGTLKVR